MKHTFTGDEASPSVGTIGRSTRSRSRCCKRVSDDLTHCDHGPTISLLRRSRYLIHEPVPRGIPVGESNFLASKSANCCIGGGEVEWTRL